ncbi:MAG: ammonia-dependent NAD(+) synthetase [Pantoea sp. Brub]|nr:ammonia-dependent NAD(+) synthetase [Pantoea sp. Brub]
MSLQKKIINMFYVKPNINVKEEIRVSINFLKKYLQDNDQIKTLVLGISGGQDSTLTGKLSQLAISEIRQERNDKHYKFIAVRLPYGIQFDEKDCQDAISFINPDISVVINIKESVLSSEKILKNAGIILSDIAKGNMKARERMKIQYSIANMKQGVVVGTGHASEAITGFFTKYGDGGSDINPLFQLNKRQIKQLLIHLNCPQHLYLKKPTADLEDLHPAKEDEMVLGITYDKIDDYLEGKELSPKHSKIIEAWYLKTKHKRHLPINMFDKY